MRELVVTDNCSDPVPRQPEPKALGVLLEPTTVVAKAWEQVRMVGQRAYDIKVVVQFAEA